MGDRVARGVWRRKEGGSGAGKRSVLERREKRRRDGGDAGRARVGIGENFEKRRRILEGRAERKREG
jgi:hypothetical protein